MNAVLLMGDPSQASGGIMAYLPMILIVVIFYFFMIRPQQQKAKKAKEFRSSLSKGAKIVTIGGIHGVIESLKEQTVIMKVKDGAMMEIERSAISMEGSASELDIQAKV